MKVLLTHEEFEFLCLNYTSFIQMKRTPKSPLITNNVVLEINELTADEIRDWAVEKLQIRGFDIDYNLTKEGEILENIIDKFYVE